MGIGKESWRQKEGHLEFRKKKYREEEPGGREIAQEGERACWLIYFKFGNM